MICDVVNALEVESDRIPIIHHQHGTHGCFLNSVMLRNSISSEIFRLAVNGITLGLI
ncbi:MAG: hypothetical protein AAF298_01640 [Cyanobacteria bacterium P01_A01_bin.40]